MLGSLGGSFVMRGSFRTHRVKPELGERGIVELIDLFANGNSSSTLFIAFLILALLGAPLLLLRKHEVKVHTVNMYSVVQVIQLNMCQIYFYIMMCFLLEKKYWKL